MTRANDGHENDVSTFNMYHKGFYMVYIEKKEERKKNIYIYIEKVEKNRETILSSLQAYFAITYASGDFIKSPDE